MSKILVSGASGFIGRALVSRLQSQGREVIPIDSSVGDIGDEKTLEMVAQPGIGHVFHLAAKTFVPDSWQEPRQFLRTNVQGTANVLEFCRKSQIPMTYVSAYVYGHPDSLPISENCPVRPSNPYALSKWFGEQLCEFYSKSYGLPVTVVRPFNVFGPGQAEHFLIPAIIAQVLDRGGVIAVKDLLPKRDYVYLEDIVAALLATQELPDGYRVFNLGSGVSLSVQQVIDTIQEVARTNKKIVSDQVIRNNELMNVVADISCVKAALGWVPAYSFQDGIESIINLERKKGCHERA